MRLFVSHVTNADGAVARRLVAYLEQHGHTCWIAPRDIAAGENYASAIAEAIEACAGIVLLLSSAVADSPAVARELELAVGRGKKPVLVIRLQNIGPPKNIAYFIAINQWIDAFDRPLEDAADDLLKALGRDAPARTALRRAAGHAQKAGRAAQRLIAAVFVSSVVLALLGATAWLNRDELAEAWTRLAEHSSPPAAPSATLPTDKQVTSIQADTAPVKSGATIEPAAEDQPLPVAVEARGPRQRGDLIRGARILRVEGASAEGAEGLLATPPLPWNVATSGVVDLEIALLGDAPSTVSHVEIGFAGPWDGQVLVSAAPAIQDGAGSYGFSTVCTDGDDAYVCLFAPQRVRALRIRLVSKSRASNLLSVSSLSAYSQ